jgi:hypothetical protein
LEPNKATAKKAWATSNLFFLHCKTVNFLWKSKHTGLEILMACKEKKIGEVLTKCFWK